MIQNPCMAEFTNVLPYKPVCASLWYFLGFSVSTWESLTAVSQALSNVIGDYAYYTVFHFGELWEASILIFMDENILTGAVQSYWLTTTAPSTLRNEKEEESSSSVKFVSHTCNYIVAKSSCRKLSVSSDPFDCYLISPEIITAPIRK